MSGDDGITFQAHAGGVGYLWPRPGAVRGTCSPGAAEAPPRRVAGAVRYLMSFAA